MVTNIGLFTFLDIRLCTLKVSLIKHTECTGGNGQFAKVSNFFKNHRNMHMLKKVIKNIQILFDIPKKMRKKCVCIEKSNMTDQKNKS